MFRRLSSALTRATLLAVLVGFASAVAPVESPALDCSSYCDAGQCQRCFVDYQLGTVGLLPNENQREAFHQPFNCMVVPEHWGQACFNIAFDAPYQIDVIVGYGGVWDGAEFDIYRDGAVIGHTSPVSGNWGYPHLRSVPYGHEVGRVTFIAECSRTYKFELRETTYPAHGFQEACDKDMLSVGVKLTVEMRRLEGCGIGCGNQVAEVFSSTNPVPATVTPVAPLQVSDAWPNPAMGPQSFKVSMDYPTRTGSMATMSVHDVSGRLVRRLPDRWISVGDSRIEWDGKDDAGKHVVPGVYFVRVRASGMEATARSIRSVQGAAGSMPMAERLPAPPATTFPNQLPPGDEEPDEGGGSPPDTVALMNMIMPFAQHDVAGDSLRLDVAGAQAAGVSSPAIQIGKAMVLAFNRIRNVWVDDPLVERESWLEPHLHRTSALDELFAACNVASIPCPSQGTRIPGCPFSKIEEVQAYLTNSEGFHRVYWPFTTLARSQDGTTYARKLCVPGTCPHPGNPSTCPCGLLREEARPEEVSCGCWTYSKFCPEPNPEVELIHNDYVLTAWWSLYVWIWHLRC